MKTTFLKLTGIYKSYSGSITSIGNLLNNIQQLFSLLLYCSKGIKTDKNQAILVRFKEAYNSRLF